MTELTTAQLEALGISQDEIIEKIVARCADGILTSVSYDEYGDEVQQRSESNEGHARPGELVHSASFEHGITEIFSGDSVTR